MGSHFKLKLRGIPGVRLSQECTEGSTPSRLSFNKRTFDSNKFSSCGFLFLQFSLPYSINKVPVDIGVLFPNLPIQYRIAAMQNIQVLVNNPCPRKDKAEAELVDGTGISAKTCRRLACDAPTVIMTHGPDGDILHLGSKTRKISRPLWRALLTRDQYCQFPGCNNSRHLKAHHIKHWANGGKIDPENLVLLCRAHHWAVHEGGFRIQGDRSGKLVFLRPDGTALPKIPTFRSVPEDVVHMLKLCNVERNLDINPETNACNWDGEPMDYDLAVMGLMQSDSRLAEQNDGNSSSNILKKNHRGLSVRNRTCPNYHS